MKKFFRRNKVSLKLNNTGLSLVELIVAVLILAIFSVSALQLFVTSARVNQVNKNQLNADTLGTSVMEAVKQNGLVGTGAEVYECQYGSATECFGIGVASATDGSDDASHATVSQAINAEGKPEYTLIPSATHKYNYALSGIVEGDGTYNVELEIDTKYVDAGTSKDVNVKDNYLFSAFDLEKAMFINPMAPEIYYDQEAIEFFVRANREYKENCYNADKASYDSKCARIRQLAQDAGKTINDSPYKEMWRDEGCNNPPSRSDYEPLEESTITDKIQRKTVIDIKYNTNPTTTDRYSVTAEMLYSLPTDENLVTPGTEFPGTGFCGNVGFDENELYLYLFYIPYKYMTSTRIASLKNSTFDFNYDNESIEIHNVTPVNVDLYVAVQSARKNGSKSLKTVFENVAGATNKDVTIYSNVTIDGHSPGSTNTTEYKLLVKDVLQTHVEEIANVTIKVYEANEDYSNGQLVRTMTSTIE